MDAQSFYLHRISPFLIRFSENFGIRWYGVSYVAGFLVAILLLRHLSKPGRLKLDYKGIDALLTYLVIGVLLGGRVGYVLFYDLSLLFQLEPRFPFWGLLAVNQGGMSSHGGFVGVTLGLFLFAKRYRVPSMHLGDAVVMVAPPGLFLGRMANFINGELFGRPTDVPWAVCFPTEIMNWTHDKIVALFHELGQKGFIIEDVEQLVVAVRENNAVASIVHPYLTPRHPSQIYEALLEGVFLFIFLWWFGKRSRRIGQTSALFFWGYAIVRIIAEQFREPDVGIGFQWLGLTRGQWLCVFMLAAGAVVWYFSARINMSLYQIKTPAKVKPSPGDKKKKTKKSK